MFFLKIPNYNVLPIRRIIKMALACKTYIITMNFLDDIFFLKPIALLLFRLETERQLEDKQRSQANILSQNQVSIDQQFEQLFLWRVFVPHH